MNEPQFPSEAVSVMAGKLHDPVFFDKLASDWKIEPRSAGEREQLLELATLLREAKDAETVKTAEDQNPFLTGAIDSLKVAMHARGYDTGPTSDHLAVKNLAAQLSANPELQKAALDYGVYLAQAAQAGQERSEEPQAA